MSLKLAGVQLGNLTGGPSSITLADLADVSIVSPVTGQYLRYNNSIEEWQNMTIDAEVFSYLDSKMTASDGIVITYSSGPNTIAFDLGAITPTSVAASGTVTGSNITGSNTGDQTITLTNDVTGSGTGTFAATLATVNASPQSNTFRKITVNGKGLTTETAAVVEADITTALGYTPVDIAGDTMTGLLLLSADPSAALGAATKQYVDNVATGITTKPAVLAATTADLTANYSNGTLGVGATLTSTTNGAWPGVDGVTTGWTIGKGVLVKNQSTPAQNGRYNLTTIGDGSNPWVLTRCGLCDTAAEIPGAYVFVQDGSQVGTGWVAIVADPLTFVVGTDAITWAQFSGAGTYTAGTGINISSNTISNTGVLSNIAGTGISVSGATGNVTLTNTGVTSAVAGSNIAVSAATGAVTFSVTGTVPLAANISGGTTGQLLYQSGVDTTAKLATSTSGFVLTSQGVGVAPVWAASDAATSTITDDTTTNATMYPTWVTATAGSLPQKVSSSKLSFNPSTGILSATGFTGGLTGAASLNVLKAGDTMTGDLTISPGVNATPAAINVTSYGINSTYIQSRANGTTGSPTALVNNDAIGGLFARGHNGTAITSASQSSMTMNAAENWTLTNNGTYIRFDNTPLGATTRQQAFRIGPHGELSAGSSTNYGTAGQVLVSSGTGTAAAWSSTMTGSASLNVLKAGDTMTGPLIGTSATYDSNSASDPSLTLSQTNAAGLALRVSAGDRVVIGDGNVGSPMSYNLQVNSATGTSGILLSRWTNDNTAPILQFGKGRSGTVGTIGTALQSGDVLAGIVTGGDDGTVLSVAGSGINFNTTELWTSTAHGSDIRFFTVPNGSVTKTETVRFTADGGIGMTTSNTIGIGIANAKPMTGSTTVTGYRLGATIQSDVTTTAYGYRSQIATVDAVFTLPTLVHFAADQSTIGASSTVTHQYGYSAGSTLTGATNNYGFYGNIAAATGRWNLYMNGAARNYLNGNTTLGLQDPVTLASSVPKLQSNTTSVTALDAVSWATGTTHNVGFGKSKSGTAGTFGAVSSGDSISLDMRYDTGATFEAGARIGGIVTGTVSAGNIPTALTFGTRNTGDANTIERLRITALGGVSFGATGTAVGTSGQLLTSAGDAPPVWSSTFTGTTTNSTNVAITDDTTTNANEFIVWSPTSSGNNGLRVSSTKLTFNPSTGQLNSTSFNATSTARVKDAIVDISKNYLDRFMNLRPREYDRKDFVAHEFGFIAEEMVNVYPEIVGKDNDGIPSGIDYGKLATILTAKVQEQQSVINELKAQMQTVMELLKGTK